MPSFIFDLGNNVFLDKRDKALLITQMFARNSPSFWKSDKIILWIYFFLNLKFLYFEFNLFFLTEIVI